MIKKDLKDKHETKKKGLMKQNLVIKYFDFALFMKQKQIRKKQKERDKKKEPKESKKIKTRRKEEEKNKRGTDKEKVKKGEVKEAKEKQRETLKIKQKCPLGGKRGFSIKSKQRKKSNKKQKH